MYLLKHLPEDFIVEELPLFGPGGPMRLKEAGRYLVVRVTKRCRNSDEVAQLLAERLAIPRRAVGFAGNKDRNAVTVQHYSLAGVAREQAVALKLKDVSVEPLGYSDEPLALGLLAGNRFTITARGLEGTEDLSLPACVPNYFDEQRFSSANARIGEAIVRKRFREAVDLLRESRAPEAALVDEFLAEHPSEPAVALTRVPKTLLKLYLHAYQSLLWNRALAKYVESKTAGGGRGTSDYSLGQFVFPPKSLKIPDATIMIPGFDISCDDAQVQRILEQTLQEAQLSPRDFVIRQLPNLSLEGGPRQALIEVKEFSVSGFEEDECDAGKKKAVFRFSLGKGSYATMLVRSILAEENALQ